MTSSLKIIPSKSHFRSTIRRIKRYWQLYLVLVLPITYSLIFSYGPMYGAQIAFRDYNPVAGILGSAWVGFANFERFFNSYLFWDLLRNTIGLNIYTLLAGFPIPIILAIAINETRVYWFKKSVQMITYAPHFISTVVMVGIIMQFLDPRIGIISRVVTLLGGTPLNYMGRPEMFQSIYVWTGIWQSMGYASIIYIAALSSIDPQLEEAAIIDGANRLQKIRHIDLPGIAPTIIILLILNIGQIMNVGFEKVYLLQNPLNLSYSEVISTYVYKVGLLRAQYSFSAAVGLFNSVINLVLLVSFNQIARKLGDTRLW